MATDIVFGIDAMQIKALSGPTDTEGAALAVQGRAFSIETEVDVENFEANNQRIDTRRYNKRITGGLEFAQHTPALLAMLGDGAVTTVGTTPNQAITYSEYSATAPKYIRVFAKAWSGDGGMTEIVARKIQPQGASLDLGTGAYAPVTCDFEGIGDSTANKVLWTASYLTGTNASLTWT